MSSLKHLLRISNLSGPLAIKIILLDSRIVFIPIVNADFGTSPESLKNRLLASMVSLDSLTFLVLEVIEELKLFESEYRDKLRLYIEDQLMNLQQEGLVAAANEAEPPQQDVSESDSAAEQDSGDSVDTNSEGAQN